MNSEKKRLVTVEDLLRLKRAERPGVEFWNDFDRQLRAKQLAALVERRPWWQEVSVARFFSGLRRYSLPLGAAGAVALTVVSLRFAPTVGPQIADQATEQSLPAVTRPAQVVAAGVSSRFTEEVASASGQTASAIESVQPTVMSGETVERVAPFGGLTQSIPLLGVPSEDPSESVAKSRAQYVEPALVATSAAEPAISRTLLSSSSRFESRTTPVRATVEPLQQMLPPGERRGSRILTAMVSMASVESAMRTTERAASRLSEEQLYDQIHRFGARGAGVNLKF